MIDEIRKEIRRLLASAVPVSPLGIVDSERAHLATQVETLLDIASVKRIGRHYFAVTFGHLDPWALRVEELRKVHAYLSRIHALSTSGASPRVEPVVLRERRR